MIPKELLDLLDLSGAQVLTINKLPKDVMVNENNGLEFTALQVVTPSFENFNNNW